MVNHIFSAIFDFNSRPSARGDEKLAQAYYDSLISIHAPPRGATRNAPINGHTHEFQFTPLREGRLSCEPQRRRRSNFNSRPSARGDAVGRMCGFRDLFQFTPLREGRREAD